MGIAGLDVPLVGDCLLRPVEGHNTGPEGLFFQRNVILLHLLAPVCLLLCIVPLFPHCCAAHPWHHLARRLDWNPSI